MRRRQIIAQRTVETARQPSPDASPGQLTYRSKSGTIVTVKATEAGLMMWTGTEWVPAHVIPTKVPTRSRG